MPEALKIGDIAPEFELPVSEKEKISLKSLKGKKVVLYFYPKDDTPGCTLEAKDFSNLLAEFHKHNAEVIGVSKDSLKSHDKFAQKCSLNLKIASDENSDIAEKYGVWMQKSFMGKKYMGIERSTFLIDEQGKITKVWPNVSVIGHAKEVLQEVMAKN